LRHLAAGTPVTRVAALLGYDNPAAYTAAFGKLLGRPPTAYANPPRTVTDPVDAGTTAVDADTDPAGAVADRPAR
jgi:hypothetical protein